MTAQEALQAQLKSTEQILSMLVADLTDADLLVRPVDKANTIAWQLGHLIVAEQSMGKQIPGAQYPDLPAGFAEQHAMEKTAADPAKGGFRTKTEYVDLFTKARAESIAAVGQLTDADLDKPTSGNVAKFVPTVGRLVTLMANHTLMHVGQFSVTRRKLDKPIVM
jgi:DinB superfamily